MLKDYSERSVAIGVGEMGSDGCRAPPHTSTRIRVLPVNRYADGHSRCVCVCEDGVYKSGEASADTQLGK